MRWRFHLVAVLTFSPSGILQAADPVPAATVQSGIGKGISAAAWEYRDAVSRAAALEARFRFAEQMAKMLQRGRMAGDKIFDEAEKNRRDSENDWGAAVAAVQNAQNKMFNDLQHLEIIVPLAQSIAPLSQAFVDADATLATTRSNLADAETQAAATRAERERIEHIFNHPALPKDEEPRAKANLEAAKVRESETDRKLQQLRKDLPNVEGRRDQAFTELQGKIRDLKAETKTLEETAANRRPRAESPRETASGPSTIRRTNFRVIKRKHHGATPLPSQSEPLIDETTFADEILPATPECEIGTHPSAPLPVTAPARILPERPAHFEPRELPADDSACLWKYVNLSSPKTSVIVEPRPGDSDVNTSIDFQGDTTSTGKSTTTVPSPPGETRAIVFDGPAYFPLTKFQDINTAFDSEGLRISEQMVLRYAQDGSYEVEFSAVALGIPTTLYLQFELEFGVVKGSITLPPIALDPNKVGRNDDDPNTWHIVHHGNSSMLRRIFEIDNQPLSINRRGVARFGSGVRSAQPYSR